MMRLIATMLAIVMLAACSTGHAPGEPLTETTAATEATEIIETTSAAETTSATEPLSVAKELLDGKKIIFIGNSFTYYGKCVLTKGRDILDQESRMNDQGYFYQICKANGIDVNVTNFTFGSHQLKDFYSSGCNRGHDGLNHFDYISDFNYDYVVLQNGSKVLKHADILSECQPIMQRFQQANPNVKFVFLVHHRTFQDNYTWVGGIKELADAGVIVVDWGTLVCDIINGDTQVPGATQEYDFNSFVISQSKNDGYHQNMLSGYITALMTYCAITGESAQGQPYSFEDHSEFSTEALAEYRTKYYKYNKKTNFDVILLSEPDMTGIQQLIDQYLAAKTYLNY